MSDTFLRVPSDGLELAVETFGAGPWLVFAHGLTGNRHGTRRQFAPHRRPSPDRHLRPARSLRLNASHRPGPV